MVEGDTALLIHDEAAAAAPLTTTEAAVSADDRITRPTEADQAGFAKPPLTTVSETTTTVDPQTSNPWRQGFFRALV